MHSGGVRAEIHDDELAALNGGAGGIYDENLKYGDVVTNIIEYNSLLKIHCEETATELVDQMRKKVKPRDTGAERRENLVAQRQAMGGSKRNAMKGRKIGGENSDSEIDCYDEKVLKQHALVEEKVKQKYSTIREHPIFGDAAATTSYDSLMPDAKDALKLEPLLKGPFALFGGQIKMEMQMASDIVSQEMYKHLKVQL